MCQQNEMSYIDPLTNLYNRTYLDYSLQGMQRGRGRNGLQRAWQYHFRRGESVRQDG